MAKALRRTFAYCHRTWCSSHQSSAICFSAWARNLNQADSIRCRVSLKCRNAPAQWMAFSRSSRTRSSATEFEKSCIIAHSCTSNLVGSCWKRSVETIRFATSNSCFCKQESPALRRPTHLARPENHSTPFRPDRCRDPRKKTIRRVAFPARRRCPVGEQSRT